MYNGKEPHNSPLRFHVFGKTLLLLSAATSAGKRKKVNFYLNTFQSSLICGTYGKHITANEIVPRVSSGTHTPCHGIRSGVSAMRRHQSNDSWYPPSGLLPVSGAFPFPAVIDLQPATGHPGLHPRVVRHLVKLNRLETPGKSRRQRRLNIRSSHLVELRDDVQWLIPSLRPGTKSRGPVAHQTSG